MAALGRHGIWKRNTFTGDICGLDLIEAMSAIPRRMDREFSRSLFIAAEHSFLSAMIEKKSNSDGERR